eukprot:scaffold51752_cov72-Phaeocystis_antarctica.AAC.4
MTPTSSVVELAMARHCTEGQACTSASRRLARLQPAEPAAASSVGRGRGEGSASERPHATAVAAAEMAKSRVREEGVRPRSSSSSWPKSDELTCRASRPSSGDG